MSASPSARTQIHAVRIAAGSARLLLGCDLVVSASAEALSKLARRHDPRDRQQPRDRSPAISPATPTCRFRAATCAPASPRAVGQGGAEFIDATRLATGLLGDSIASNLFMLGYAYQKGLVPVSAAAIERAIELNGVAVDFNRNAFLWGRRAALDPASVEARAVPPDAVPESHRLSESLDEIIARRVAFLTQYQNAAYAERYAARIRRLRAGRGGALRRQHRADRGGRPRAVQADGLQGRIRGRPALCRDRFRPACRRAVRGSLRIALPSRAAAAGRARPGHRASEEKGLRPVDARRVPGARATAPAARHRIRHFRPHRRASRPSGV